MLYYSLFYSVINYCILIYESANLNVLQSIYAYMCPLVCSNTYKTTVKNFYVDDLQSPYLQLAT
jgi:hypothetical protein